MRPEPVFEERNFFRTLSSYDYTAFGQALSIKESAPKVAPNAEGIAETKKSLLLFEFMGDIHRQNSSNMKRKRIFVST